MIHRSPDGISFWLAVVSGGRPENVEPMTELVAPATWYVAESEPRLPEYASAALDVGADVALCEPWPSSRNEAMEAAFARGMPVVELDDDLVWVRRCYPGEDRKPEPISPLAAVGEIVDRVAASDFHLGGAAPTVNAYFSRQRTTSRGFVRSGVLVVEESEPRIDLGILIKHDYDFTLQHVERYGGVVRCDDLLFNFKQRTNAGGVQPLRETDANERDVETILARWPGVARRHATREGELSLRFGRTVRELAT